MHCAMLSGSKLEEKAPTAAILDSQSVRTTEQGGIRGYDAGKKVAGRKRHLLVDTLGLILLVCVHPANVQDRDGARLLLAALRQRFGWLRCIWADGGYAGELVQWVHRLRHQPTGGVVTSPSPSRTVPVDRLAALGQQGNQQRAMSH